ncbi:hypothetical protein ACQPWW_14065 [Micromonospora sp. CA-240977]|uniref:hypothetical protein n=1 Tax=Micromonospora sp. CA-240977 TaxID=3239957 RepID=UPI003D8FC25B
MTDARQPGVPRPGLPPGASVRFSCVVDGPPRYLHEAWIWSTTLLRLARRQPHEVVVHLVEGVDSRHLDFLRDLGVEVRTVAPFDKRHPYSNKLSQLQSEALQDADLVVLTDCDIAFAGDVDGLFSGVEMIAAKTVDLARPSYEHWRRIFTAAGFDTEPELALATHSREPTFARNFNGGVYVLTRAAFAALRDAWPRWTRWLLDRPEILGDLTFHTDQVAFGLATHELGLAVRVLTPRFNYPTHLVDPMPSDPVMLHYHQHLDGNGYLRVTGHDAVDARIDRVNQVLAAERHAASPP